MTKIYDFKEIETAPFVFYSGDAGAKIAMIHDNSIWMLKFPKSTRDLEKPNVSYTTSPLSEFLGSQIYASLDLPTHDTLLGIAQDRKGQSKLVVACRDFTRSIAPNGVVQENARLIPFHDLKNEFMLDDVEAYSGTGSSTPIDEVLATIRGQSLLAKIPNTEERFWDMFVIDAFIGNNDRNNNNWGIIVDTNRNIELAPVFDNGNAFFNKRSIQQMEERFTNEKHMIEDACANPLSIYRYAQSDGIGPQIKPFAFMQANPPTECTAAMERFAEQVNIGKIKKIINDIPETMGILSIMPETQKRFYNEILNIRYEQILKNIKK